MKTKDLILQTATQSLARNGYAATTIRDLAQEVHISPSVLYYYYRDKDTLLRATRNHIIHHLQQTMPSVNTTSPHSLTENIIYQLRHRELIVALLQYFMAVKEDFTRTENGYIPGQSYQHIADYIKTGINAGQFPDQNIAFSARLVQHAIDGFLMEYAGRDLSEEETKTLAAQIGQFVEAGLGRRKEIKKVRS